MKDRGIKKWQPFNSCFSSADVLKEISCSKAQKEPPLLSEDQLINIEEKIKDAFFLGTKINIKIFYNGKIIEKSGKVENINFQEKKICLNRVNIYFKQILEIY